MRTTKIEDGFGSRMEEEYIQATPRHLAKVEESDTVVLLKSDQGREKEDYRNPASSRNLNYNAKIKFNFKKSHSPIRNKSMSKNILNVMQNSFNSSYFDDSSSKFFSMGYSDELRNLVRERKGTNQSEITNFLSLPPLIKNNQVDKSSKMLHPVSTLNKEFDKDNSHRS